MQSNLVTEGRDQGAPEDFTDRAFLCSLVEECRKGDTRAMQKIYLGYRSSVFNVAYRFAGNHASAEDLLQEVFLKVFRSIRSLRAPEAFNSWVYRIAINTCMSFVRKRAKVREVMYYDGADGHEGSVQGDATRHDLERAITTLPPKQRSVFLLHDLEGFTHSEIASIMGWSTGTSKSQLFKARMRMRNYLTGDTGSE